MGNVPRGPGRPCSSEYLKSCLETIGAEGTRPGGATGGGSDVMMSPRNAWVESGNPEDFKAAVLKAEEAERCRAEAVRQLWHTARRRGTPEGVRVIVIRHE
jgi:hypothetical protein